MGHFSNFRKLFLENKLFSEFVNRNVFDILSCYQKNSTLIKGTTYRTVQFYSTVQFVKGTTYSTILEYRTVCFLFSHNFWLLVNHNQKFEIFIIDLDASIRCLRGEPTDAHSCIDNNKLQRHYNKTLIY